MEITVLSYNIEGLTLEANYCTDQTLKNYIINKSEYLNKYLPSIDADIMCIQEYTPILNLNFNDDYNCIIVNRNAIYFKKNKFEYLKHKWNDKLFGLIVTLDVNNFIVKVGTHRLTPYAEGADKRKLTINCIDQMAKNKILIFAADTNMRKKEERPLKNLLDCFHLASITTGTYTYDKKTNPYFFGDNEKVSRTRYDKIYCSNIFDCQILTVIKPNNDKKLIHPLYPYGGLSDHYPIMALLQM